MNCKPLVRKASRASNLFRFCFAPRKMWSFSAFPPGGIAGIRLRLLGLLVFAMAAILAWVVLLRRQVHRQTGIIRQSEERFRHLAEHDGLTGLPVRRVLMERLELALHEIQRQPASLALLMVDVDSFKQLNDSFGHAVGDQVLCTIANRLQQSVRLTDTVARMGGDEFTVLLNGLRHESEAQKIASQLVSNVCAPIVIDGRTVEVSVSVGVATCPEDGDNVETLLRNSDAALYQAKARGRNCYQIYSADTVPFLLESPLLHQPDINNRADRIELYSRTGNRC